MIEFYLASLFEYAFNHKTILNCNIRLCSEMITRRVPVVGSPLKWRISLVPEPPSNIKLRLLHMSRDLIFSTYLKLKLED